MRRAALLFFFFLLSGFATLAIMGTNIGNGPLRFGPASDVSPDRAKVGSGARYATARRLVASGRLRDAQDEYLKILQDAPLDSGAMQGLVAIRRRLAADDPTVLRRQAAAYRQAIARGAETPEHYSPGSMELLASASLQAAAAIESAQKPANRTAPPPRPSAPGTSGAPTTPGSPSTEVNAPQVPKRGATPPPPASTQPAAPATTPPALLPAPAAPPAATPPAQPPQPATSPPTGATGPDKPASSADVPATGPPPSPPADAQQTVAVVAPPQEPSVTPSQGSLVAIDCQRRTLVLRGANGGDEEYFTTPTVTIYIRGAQSKRLPDFCGLQGYVGSAVTVWTVAVGDRKIAKEVSVTP